VRLASGVTEFDDGLEDPDLWWSSRSPAGREVTIARAVDDESKLLGHCEYDALELVGVQRPAGVDSQALVGEQLGDSGAKGSSGRHLFLVTFPVPPEDQQEFDEWYREEHVPMLMAHRSWATMPPISGAQRESRRADPNRLARACRCRRSRLAGVGGRGGHQVASTSGRATLVRRCQVHGLDCGLRLAIKRVDQATF
jgi:hypothetical protein